MTEKTIQYTEWQVSLRIYNILIDLFGPKEIIHKIIGDLVVDCCQNFQIVQVEDQIPTDNTTPIFMIEDNEYPLISASEVSNKALLYSIFKGQKAA